MSAANSDESAKGKVIGKPFKPGQSGNPNGRPKNPLAGLIREKTKDGAEIVKKVLEVLRTAKKPGDIMHAAEFLRDTGWHKPITPSATTDTEGNDLQPAIVFIPAGKKS